MKIVTTSVGRLGPDDEDRNDERLEAARHAIERALKLGAEVIVFPGGFFRAYNSAWREKIAASLIDVAKEQGIGIIFGIDQQTKRPVEDINIISKGLLLPYFGYAWSPSQIASLMAF